MAVLLAGSGLLLINANAMPLMSACRRLSDVAYATESNVVGFSVSWWVRYSDVLSNCAIAANPGRVLYVSVDKSTVCVHTCTAMMPPPDTPSE